MAVKKRSYSELIKMKRYDERLRYLLCFNKIGAQTFGPNRYFNQAFYHSSEWSRTKRDIILRDGGKDLGISGLDIFGPIYIHHINPISIEDIESGSSDLIDPENLICCSMETHNKIHFMPKVDVEEWIERSPNDTCPWRV